MATEEIFGSFDNDADYAEEMDQIQLVGMKLGDEEYAIDVLGISTIIRMVDITVVPRMESYILGVMNLRGRVVPVIDLRIRFNMPTSDFKKSTRIIVVTVNNENIGFVVDEVTEVIRIKRSMVEPTPPLVGSISQEYILGICKYDKDRLVMLLDIARVIIDSGEYNESELRRKILGTSKPAPTYNAPALEAAPAPAPAPAADSSAEHEASMHDETGIESGSADSDIEDSIDALIAKELAMREAETEELNKKKRDSASVSNDTPSVAPAQVPASTPEVLSAPQVAEEALASISTPVPASAVEEAVASAPTVEEPIISAPAPEPATIQMDSLVPEPAPAPAPAVEEVVASAPKAQEPAAPAESEISIDDDILNDALNQSNAIFQTEQNHIDQGDLEALILTAPEQNSSGNNALDNEIDLSIVDPNAIPMVEIITHAPEVISELDSSKNSARVVVEHGQDTSPSSADSIQVTITDLKTIADKIISGDQEATKIDTRIKGEIGELLRLIIDTKHKVDDIDPFIEKSQENLPKVTSALENINDVTENATLNLMEASDKMCDFYKKFITTVDQLKGFNTADKAADFNSLYDQTFSHLSDAEALGFKILESLEFQDITEQKLRKVIKSIEDMGSRLANVIGILNTSAEDTKADKRKEQLLQDYGLS